ncbi:hypothetical protein FHN55_13430 [Streptomyces sp. NP160]|uniref:hypothetical protein n=1 Tax=Streptomyces sp. NP160 TaxID=2586637 RepID=UPI001119BA04|nr:hypothetical protein [Streptomyces sp. NP160]TNM64524.1 hypothetical protein FHN55_13430 [Streptomyces sp. NP160]
MGSGSVSLLEERLAARLWWRAAAHPEAYELDPDLGVVDPHQPPTAAAVVEDDDEEGRAAEAPPAGLSEPSKLLPEACLVGVRDQVALEWAARTPGVELVAAVEELWAHLAVDLQAACRSTDTAVLKAGGDPGAAESSGDSSGAGSACAGVCDAELVEAVAACERQMAALAARRDQLAGVFASRRQAEAEADVAEARAATARDGKGRPWATRVRSTAPSELCARLGIGSLAAEALVERGLAAVGAHRDVAAAMAAGALGAGAGSWLLEQLSAVRTTSYLSALEREAAAREQTVKDAQAAQDAARAQAGQAPLTGEEVRARAAADQAQVDAAAEAAAAAHAEQVAAAVRRELLGRATGSTSWSADGAGSELAPHSGAGGTADDGSPGPSTRPSTRPTAGAGLGPNRRAWTKRLSTAVHRADAAAAQRRSAKARAACSTARWSEADGQAALQLRGPAEDIAVITAAMDARARRRQEQARAAERAAARAQGRAYDRAAVGSLDQHRIAALREWATAALEISETCGVAGTWYPIARTAASKPVVHLVLPWTVLAGVSTIGAQLAGYGPVGAVAALRIAADGLWRRVLADPACGAAVAVEEGAWRPSTALARLVGLRWWSSTMPSSTRPVGLDHGPAGGGGGGGSAGGGQLDHVQPYEHGNHPGNHPGNHTDDRAGGSTEATNLQLLAQVEHLLKQAGEHARPGHGWSVAVDTAAAGPAPGDGVVWTSPTGHTYRVSPQALLDPDDDPGTPDGTGASGGPGEGGLPPWVHRLLADVLPAWVGWPPDGRPAPSGPHAAVPWSPDWTQVAFSDVPPDPAPDGHEEPCLFDDLPAA